MAEDNRGLPPGPDRPERGLARTDQGAGRSRQGLARTGQSAARSRSGSDQPRPGTARPRQSSIPPPPGLDPALRESIRSQQEEERRRQEEQRRRQEEQQRRQEEQRGQDADRAEQDPARPPNGPERRPRARKRRRRQRSIMSRVAGALLYVLLVIGASAVLATVGWSWASDLLGLNKEYTSIEITITDDTDFAVVVDRLEEEGLIQYKFLFKLYARFSHAEDKIAPGTYALDTEMDYRALVANMGSSSATRQTTDVTIPEGYNLDQIFSLLEEKGVSTVEKLRDMAANWDYAFDWLRDIPLGDYHRLEGYLFPDTYTFEMGGNPKYVINKMLVNFDAKMDEYMAKYSGEDAPYSLHDIVIIASMIEKETDGTVDDEHGRNDYKSIASVIYNRLENPGGETAGYLQLDSTLVYLSGNHVLTEEDKAIDSPFNTYLYKGLPAGPISNPGMMSLLAAMEPANTKYYYYLLNPETRQHEYSRTYAEHQKLYDRYYGNG